MQDDLKTLSFGELITVKQAVGTKAFHKAMKGQQIEAETEEETIREEKPVKNGRKVINKREDKNMPQEITSKKPVTRKRQIIETSSKSVFCTH